MDKKIIAIIVLAIIIILGICAFLLFLVLFNKKAQYKNKILKVLEKNDTTSFNDLVKDLNDESAYVHHFITRYFFFFQDLYLHYDIDGYFDEPENLKFVKKKEEDKKEELLEDKQN